MKVHIAVCTAFHGSSPDPTFEVGHLNGDTGDNRPENLKWGSKVRNQWDRLGHDTHNRGTHCGTSKLTEQQVREIRTSSLSSYELAEVYPVSDRQIRAIVERKAWAWFDETSPLSAEEQIAAEAMSLPLGEFDEPSHAPTLVGDWRGS